MVGVLGPIQFVAARGTCSPRSATQRRLLAILALHAPEPVRAERLAALMDLSPSGLRTTVTRLRRVLGDDVLASNGGGYRLTPAVDARVFSQALAALPTARASKTRLRALERALALWRGPAFEEFAHEEWAAGAAARLDELYAAATEDHAEELVEAHRWSDAIAELSDHIVSHPLRDRPRGLLMRALSGDGRQAEALRVYREYRQLLADQVGTEPSPAVQLVGRRIAGGWTGE
jgi:DNA-binding SARP family transcriptional activator